MSHNNKFLHHKKHSQKHNGFTSIFLLFWLLSNCDAEWYFFCKCFGCKLKSILFDFCNWKHEHIQIKGMLNFRRVSNGSKHPTLGFEEGQRGSASATLAGAWTMINNKHGLCTPVFLSGSSFCSVFVLPLFQLWLMLHSSDVCFCSFFSFSLLLLTNFFN